MKIIGITGNYGRTSIAKMLYDYFQFAKVKTSLYCSNRVYSNVVEKKTDVWCTVLL